jgi:hypothetical protein
MIGYYPLRAAAGRPQSAVRATREVGGQRMADSGIAR